METVSFLEHKINGKRVAELLPGDPKADTESAYRLLRLFYYHWYPTDIYSESDPYSLIENSLKKQHMAYRTGIAPENQEDKEVEHVSVLDSLIFFREIGVEAEAITFAIENTWKFFTAKEKLNIEEYLITQQLLIRAGEGDELALSVLGLIKKWRKLVFIIKEPEGA